jgi:predicted CXXCH cytochrome family protein
MNPPTEEVRSKQPRCPSDGSTIHGTHTIQGKEGRLVRRLAIVVIGGALWLLLAAIPALADGGPHVMTSNNGSTGIKADGCASCHRIHTSKSPTGFLLVTGESTITNYCRSCHGATGTGASTDVDSGVQYALGGTDGITRDTGTTIGALRGGGFVETQIGSDVAYRLVSNTGSVSNSKVPVSAVSNPVTSSHLAIATGVTAKDVVWGSGALGTAGAGPTLAAEMECTACHNPHGNGNYRILQGIPDAGDPQVLATTAVNVKDASYDPDRTRNYTVIQVPGTTPAGADPTPAEEASWLLYADQVLQARVDGAFNGITGDYTELSGDYLHKALPYNATGTYPFDAPNARPNTSLRPATGQPEGGWTRGDPAGFNMQMTSWCAQCHTRYMAPSGSRSTPSIDSIYTYRHTTAYNRTCTTCHVAHGTSAVMNQVTADGTTYSANVPYPDGTTTVGDSRLLKVDNRGTCQLCHDPTNGSAATAAGVTSIGQGPLPLIRP